MYVILGQQDDDQLNIRAYITQCYSEMCVCVVRQNRRRTAAGVAVDVCLCVCVCRAKQSPFSLTAAEPKPKSKSTSVAKQQQFWPSSCDLLFALHYFSSSTAQSMNSNLPTCTTTRFVLVHLACLVCVLFLCQSPLILLLLLL